MKSLFLDAEWTLDQEIFLMAYAFKNGGSGSIFGRNLNTSYLTRLLRMVHYIYVYGPDIAYLEKNFPIDFRQNFYCINMLRLVKMVIPGLTSYKLEDLEHMFRLPRSTRKYKTSVFTIWRHWADPRKRAHVIRYNLEDARNLRSLFQILASKYYLTQDIIRQCRLI